MTLSADVLTFTGNVCAPNSDGSGGIGACTSNGAFISQAYGDTANVNVTYLVSGPFGSSTMATWIDPNVYSDLSGVAYGFFGATYASITLAPTLGNQVTLNSLNLGTAPPSVTRPTTVDVWDLATNSIVFTTTVSVGANAALVSPGVTSAVGLELRYSPDTFNVALDNVNFTVTGTSAATPEPATFGLFGAASAAVLALRLRNRAKR